MSPSIDQKLFDAEFLRRLPGLALQARQMARQRQNAERRSPHRGANVEFAEYRPFQSGDDWKHIDWNAYARWRTLVLKLYVEEKDLPVHLLLDNTASMDWGAPRKFDQARRLAAGLAYLALDRHDRTGVVPLAGGESKASGTLRGMGVFHGLLGRLSAYRCRDSAEALETLSAQWLRPRPETGLVVVLSDLFGNDWNDAVQMLDRLRYARHEVVVVQITDVTERAVNDVGEYVLKAREGDRSRLVTIDQRVCRAYAAKVRDYEKKIDQFCRSRSIPLLPVDTSEEVISILSVALRQKGVVG